MAIQIFEAAEDADGSANYLKMFIKNQAPRFAHKASISRQDGWRQVHATNQYVRKRSTALQPQTNEMDPA
jgi:hypothetical protein